MAHCTDLNLPINVQTIGPLFQVTDPNNYRPISVLPVVSKLIERVVFNQLYEYLNNNNLLTESQSGFRPMFSTETALLEATNEWLWNIDNSLLNGVIFLDLKKAFDTMEAHGSCYPSGKA